MDGAGRHPQHADIRRTERERLEWNQDTQLFALLCARCHGITLEWSSLPNKIPPHTLFSAHSECCNRCCIVAFLLMQFSFPAIKIMPGDMEKRFSHDIGHFISQ